ncbi:MAG: iron-sulfur cluster assembly accessory protein [Gammaproteobacteria bacterium]|nr:iron-sulfur cluster assembly accessory protein [Pseudomonadota bacterium]MCH9663095.1 iron-sulfur cluster assembly accessory protein [Gammaproteobacteria bacterium]
MPTANRSAEQTPPPGIVGPISLSLDAATHVRNSLNRRGKGLGIRLRIKKAGCSGYEYIVEFADEEEAMDHHFECEGVHVLVDPKSLVVLRGTRLNYVRQGLNKGFAFENPNEKARCGCGESFSV